MSSSRNSSRKQIVQFCFDLVCPYAYLASLQIESLAERCNAEIKYIPVLLGGIYKANESPQGKDGSASNVMSLAKRKLIERDFARMSWRNGVTWPLQGLKRQKKNMNKATLQAMRILSATEGEDRRNLTHLFFCAFQRFGHDLSDDSVLRSIVQKYYNESSKDVSNVKLADHLMGNSKEASDTLRKATDKAFSDGAFGVPTFFIHKYGEKEPLMIFGFDRLFLLERFLGRKEALPLLVMPNTKTTDTRIKRKLTFFYDFSSPWAFIGNQRLILLLQKYATSNHTKIDIEFEPVPILLGALFKEVGIPVVPLLQQSKNKQKYMSLELKCWQDFIHQEQHYHQHQNLNEQKIVHHINASLKWPDSFPLRTVTPLRCTILNPMLRNTLFRAVWQKNKNIGDKVTLFQVLCSANSFDDEIGNFSEKEASKIIKETYHNKNTKNALFANTKRAYDLGVCGVPSFQVDDGEIIFGQDRLNVVEDLLNGWVDLSDSQSLFEKNLGKEMNASSDQSLQSKL